MVRKVTFADGREVEVSCLSCAVVNGLIEATGGVIVETDFFHAHQDLAYPIPGLIILAAKRHFYTMDELTDEEADDFMLLIRKLRKAQREVFGMEHVYYFYNEDTTHHFHLWMVRDIDGWGPLEDQLKACVLFFVTPGSITPIRKIS